MARSLHTAAHRELVSELIAMRKAAGMSQRQLAAHLGREQNFVARVETGERRVDVIELAMICRACGVDAGTGIEKLIRKVLREGARSL